jgi:SAM-dependent methyltransferase
MRCGSCDSSNTEELFSLGDIPPVNDFLKESDLKSEVGHPLRIFFCRECTLVQLGEHVPPASLFSHYLHLSSASKSNLTHLEEVAAIAEKRVPGGLKGKKVLEIGSNDGSLLKNLKAKGASVLGVDPAKNLAKLVSEQGIEVIADFFLEGLAKKVRGSHGAFDFVVALNVIAHTPEFVSALKGVRELLSTDGTFMMENAYVVDTIVNGQFDTIYHEHVYNFSATSLSLAFERAGLKMIDAEIIPTQGTSIRAFGVRKESKVAPSPRVAVLLDAEKKRGLTDISSYREIGKRVTAFKKELRARIEKLNAKFGNRAIGLGAPARGVVILNYCELGTKYFEMVIDDTPLKQGLLVPGQHIPVRGWDALKALGNAPRVYLLLSWNYKKDMLEKLKKHVGDGVVIVPFPEFDELDLKRG